MIFHGQFSILSASSMEGKSGHLKYVQYAVVLGSSALRVDIERRSHSSTSTSMKFFSDLRLQLALAYCVTSAHHSAASSY